MTTGLEPFTVHVAAPSIGWIQTCAACGFTLLDNTAWGEGRVQMPVGDADRGPSWWPVGQQIATDKTAASRGGMTYVIEGRPLDDDERMCAGVN